MSFRLAVLENDWVRIACCPDLGGRIVSWFDKRGEVDVLPRFVRLDVREGGPRGLWSPQGIEIACGPDPRGNSLGPVDFLVRDAVDEASEASIVLHELIPGLGVSWHATLALAADAPRLAIRFRAVDRTWAPIPLSSGLSVGLPESVSCAGRDAVALHAPGRRAGLVFDLSGRFWEEAEPTEFGLRLRWIGEDPPQVLLPRDRQEWELAVWSYTDVERIDAVTPGLVVGSRGSALRLVAPAQPEGWRAFALVGEQTLEAPLRFGRTGVAIPTDGLSGPIEGLAVHDADGEEVVRWWAGEEPVRGWRRSGGRSLIADALRQCPRPVDGDDELADAVREMRWFRAWLRLRAGRLQEAREDLQAASAVPGLRAAVLAAEAALEVREGRLQQALARLDDLLLIASEDHLAWWLKAVLHRLAGEDPEGEEDPLLNAHYLAPLEPALRAESFLRQSMEQGREPNPILRPLAAHPEALVEVACLLLEAGATAEAARWIDEALRHRDGIMLRYLGAWNLLVHTRMQAEAADMVARAGRLSLEPPLPWRPIERLALEALGEAFPEDERLRQFRDWARAYEPRG